VRACHRPIASMAPFQGRSVRLVRRSFIGQLTPYLPAELPSGVDAASSGCEHNGIVWQRGPFNSWWLRVGTKGSKTPSHSAFSAALDEAEARAAAAPTPGAAVYVCVNELAMEPAATGLLRAHGYKFHHYHKPVVNSAPSEYHPGDMVYYRWMGPPHDDRVPAYSTSIVRRRPLPPVSPLQPCWTEQAACHLYTWASDPALERRRRVHAA
jgi:hypothetical protein